MKKITYNALLGNGEFLLTYINRYEVGAVLENSQLVRIPRKLARLTPQQIRSKTLNKKIRPYLLLRCFNNYNDYRGVLHLLKQYHRPVKFNFRNILKFRPVMEGSFHKPH